MRESFVFLFLFALLSALLNDAAAHEHVCQTPELTPKNLKRQSMRVTNWAEKRVNAAAPNLRISVRFDSSIISLPNKDEISEFTQKAMNFWSTSLLVKYPLEQNLLVEPSCSGDSIIATINNTQRSCCVGSSQTCKAPSCNGAEYPADILMACCWCDSTDPASCRVEGTDGPGLANTDLLMLVIAKPVLSCSGVNTALAYASACTLEDSYWRPVVGMVNLCPMVVEHTSGLDPFSEIQLLKHEIAHALGFSSSLYAFWRAQNGSTLSPVGEDGFPIFNGSYVISEEVIRKVKRNWLTINGPLEREFTYVVTPTLTQTLRDFFGCPEIEGAELENHGSSGTAGSHFEMRLFPSEAMSGVLSEWLYMSNISLALMQDTGWYLANFSNAEPYYHGKGLGCKFARESCLTWIRDQRAAKEIPEPYCDRLTSPSASRQERRGTCPTKNDQVSICTLTINTASIDPMYRYFNSTVPNGSPTDDPARYGGAQYADYCPYLQLQRSAPLNPAAYANRYRVCKNENAHVAVQYDPYFETYGPSSICLRQTTPVRLHTCNYTAPLYSDANTWGAGCYEVVCGAKSVDIRAQNTLIHSCTAEHSVFTFEASAEGRIYQGSLVCPSCQDACGTQACPMTKVDASTVNDEYLWEIATTRNTVTLNMPASSRCRGAAIGPHTLAILLLLILTAATR